MLLIYIKWWKLKNINMNFRDKKKPKEDIQAFKATAPGIAKFFLSQFSDVQFFITASFNAETMVSYLYVCIYAYTSLYVYMHVYMCIYKYVCIYIYIWYQFLSLLHPTQRLWYVHLYVHIMYIYIFVLVMFNF
jgi:hypothetical protein